MFYGDDCSDIWNDAGTRIGTDTAAHAFIACIRDGDRYGVRTDECRAQSGT